MTILLEAARWSGRALPQWVLATAAVALLAAQGVADPPAAVRQAPVSLRPGDHGVGRIVPARTFTDLDGRRHEVAGASTPCRFTVFAMTSTSCPLSRKYLPTLVAIAASLPADVRIVLVDPIATDAPVEMRRAADRLAGTAVYVHDTDGTLARSLGGTTTTDVVVIDAARTVVYHGAIDDQYGFGYGLDEPRHRYLADALAALVAGGEPAVAATDAPGCDLDRGETAATPAAEITYHNRVSRILQRHCVECHRDGGVAPFPLDAPEAVAAHAPMIKNVVERGTMPPWFAADEPPSRDAAGAGHAVWANDRSLATADKVDLLGWLAGGAPLGDPRDAPAPRTFPDGWLIGQPDAVWEFAEPVAVKATGTMPYQNIVVETGLNEERWVRAIEVRPGDRGVVHHVLVQLVEPGKEGGRSREGGHDFWAAYVPGQSTFVYPEGFAKRLPKGARLRFQMHYTPNGTATTDRTRIGVVFADRPPHHEVKVAGIENTRISIPPHAGDHREVATQRLPFDANVMSFMPHMHLRGKACRYELVTRDGTTSTLLDIPRYDFNWQLLYRCARPLELHAGDTIRFTAWFDNSADNPANPDPSQTVRWGQQTFDEMLLGYVEYFLPREDPSRGTGQRPRRGPAAAER